MTEPTTAPIDAFGGWPAVLGRLLDGTDLGAEQAYAALATVFEGRATDAQLAALIVGLRLKGETVDELVGMVDAMLDAATPLDLPADTIDIVGTGGSPQRRVRALNVSTMACIVAAAAGATVCKHGNIKASSTSGSFNLLEQLGVPFDVDAETLAAQVRDHRLGFCFARAYHPAMRFAGPVRAELGVPTVFNVLGPLSHPGRVARQVVGVGDVRMVRLIGDVLAARGSRSLVVHGIDSLDELTLSGSTTVLDVRDGTVTATELTPGDVGLDVVAPGDMPGGTPEDNLAIAQRVLAGEPGPARDIVALNAGAGLYVADLVSSIADGVEAATAALDAGTAQATLDALVSSA